MEIDGARADDHLFCNLGIGEPLGKQAQHLNLALRQIVRENLRGRVFWRARKRGRWQQRLSLWQMFQPTTRSMLSRVEELGGAALAEQLAETIRREHERPNVPADQRHRS